MPEHYTLTVTHMPTRGLVSPCVLSADLEVHPQSTDDAVYHRPAPTITRAFIDLDDQGRVSLHGMNAFRALALAEAIIAKALTPEMLVMAARETTEKSEAP